MQEMSKKLQVMTDLVTDALTQVHATALETLLEKAESIAGVALAQIAQNEKDNVALTIGGYKLKINQDSGHPKIEGKFKASVSNKVVIESNSITVDSQEDLPGFEED